jgi:putative CocE/NonD family hydrolase
MTNPPADRPAEVASPNEPPRGPLSPETGEKICLTHNLRVPMRDGIELALDLLSACNGEPRPVVLLRTPYDKTRARDFDPELYELLTSRGYAIAFQDCRGRFNSDGDFFPYMHEGDDGYDTVEWIAAQQWCDGRVAMIGASYAAQAQWYAAVRQPPHLRAIVPVASPPGSLWRNEPICGGAFLLPITEWMVRMGDRSWQTVPDPDEVFSKPREYYETHPLADVPRTVRMQVPWFSEMMLHPTFDAFWKAGSYDQAWSQVAVPALNVTGWWDMNFPGAPLNYSGVKSEGATAEARDGQKLIIGPWPHWLNRSRALNGLDFGDHAVIELRNYIVRFLDRWVKGVDNGIDSEKSVYVFLTGANDWLAANEFPPSEATEARYYFHSGGSANGNYGNGLLTLELPGDEPPDRYEYDPLKAGFNLWNVRDGPVDDRAACERNDVLCFTSPELEEVVDVVGWATCCLYASTTARDTDWHARLADVHPDGSVRFLCHGVLRARFRESLEKPSFLEPSKPYLFEFTMDAVGNRFDVGHRIRVEVASSWFPRFDRNMNVGSTNPFKESTPIVTLQTVYHDETRPSHVVLSVVRSSDGARNLAS